MKDLTRSLVRDVAALTEVIAWWAEHQDEYKDLISRMEKLGYEVSLSSTGLEFRGSGDATMLRAGFKELRVAGFKPGRRPEENTTYFSTFFHSDHEDETAKSIWFIFSSTVCKKVKIGTEMREVDIYEIRCDESMEITEEETE